MSTLVEAKPQRIVNTNLPNKLQVANLLNGEIHDEYQKSKKKKKPNSTGNSKGRPMLHPFEGRITFLRKEVEEALQDGPAFIEKMQAAHALSEERRATLLADGIISEFVEMFYTFQGPVPMVLEEMWTVIERFKDRASIRCDFHKVKTYTNARDENYVAPTPGKDKDGNDIIAKVEAVPDRIYGYVKVIMSKDGD